MILRRTGRLFALAVAALMGCFAKAAIAQEAKRTESAQSRSADETSAWSLGVDTGIAWRRADVAPPERLFLPPARPTIDFYALAQLLSYGWIGLHGGFGWELDGLIPTRTLIAGVHGQPGVHTNMFTNEVFASAVVRATSGWLAVQLRGRAGASFTTLQYSSDADGKVFSNTHVGGPLSLGGGIVVMPSSRLELLLEGAYRMGIGQRAPLYLTESNASVPSDPSTFVEVDRRGPVLTIGIAYRP